MKRARETTGAHGGGGIGGWKQLAAKTRRVLAVGTGRVGRAFLGLTVIRDGAPCSVHMISDTDPMPVDK